MDNRRGPVLVVDDEPDIVEFLTTVLVDEGYTTETASNGMDAMTKIAALNPSLVILDLMMPKMNGFEVLDALRADSSHSHPSVIVLSAKSSHHDILQALERGANDFIPKPFDLEDLLLRVRVWLERSETGTVSADLLRIFALGPFRVLAGDTLLLDEESGDPKTRLLLKYLVTEWDQPVQRSTIRYLLWPDLDDAEADSRLRALLENVHPGLPGGALAEGYVHMDGTMVRLNVNGNIWVDAHEFETHVKVAQSAQEDGDMERALSLFLGALALYKEDYLRDNLYDDWPSDRRERLRELWISSMFRVAAICADRCEYADSVRLMKKVLDIDPYRENAYQALMLYLSRAGRRGEAIQLYRYAERLFAQHLAAQPAPSTRLLYEKILRGEAG